MSTVCIVLTPHPRQLSGRKLVEVDNARVKHILVYMRSLDAMRFYTAFTRHVETSYQLDPREGYLVYYALSEFPADKLDVVIEELRQWIEAWLKNDRTGRSQ